MARALKLAAKAGSSSNGGAGSVQRGSSSADSVRRTDSSTSVPNARAKPSASYQGMQVSQAAKRPLAKSATTSHTSAIAMVEGLSVLGGGTAGVQKAKVVKTGPQLREKGFVTR